jgi:chromosomal replication initiation ATPase DnaA
VDWAVDVYGHQEAFGLVDGAQLLWTACADVLREQVSEAVWLTTFNAAQPVGLADGTLVLAVPSSVVKERIEGRYLTLVKSALADAGAPATDLQIEVRTGEADDHGDEPRPSGDLPPIDNPSEPTERHAARW